MGQNDREFTENELQLLRFLWKQGRATLHQLGEALPSLSSAAVQQHLNRLIQDGFVTCDRSAREATFALVEEEPLPAGPAEQPHDKARSRPVPSFLSGILNQFGPAAGAAMAAAGTAVVTAAGNAARKAVADATAKAVANATSAGGKAMGSMLKAAGKAALSKVTGAKKADQVVEQIADTAADIGKQVSESVAGVVAKIVTEATKHNQQPGDKDRPPHKDG